MKTLLALACLALSSCTLPPIGDANPLDRPGDEKGVNELHTENIRAITGNPGYRLP